MNRRWKFSDLEFAAMWAALDEEHVPAPFMFTTDIKLEVDYQRACRLAVERLRMEHGFALDTMFADMRDADIRVEVNGYDERDEFGADGVVRVLGTRRGDTGYVVTAEPGRSYFTSSSFIVTECAALELATEVARALPDVPAGSGADLALDTGDERSDLDYSFGQSAVHDTFEETATQRAVTFHATKAACRGRIAIIQGKSRFGPRGISRHVLRWRDFADDGRYVIDDQHPPVATGADRNRLVGMINARIAEVVRAIKDERA
ncbi:ESX secretion-associated protein EspG [Nocardia sp. NPDC055029]